MKNKEKCLDVNLFLDVAYRWWIILKKHNYFKSKNTIESIILIWNNESNENKIVIILYFILGFIIKLWYTIIYKFWNNN